MSTSLVSRTFNVPRGTIQFRLKHKNIKSLPGPSSVLFKDEEDSLVEWMLESFRKGFPNRRIDLILSVANIIKLTDRKNPFKNGIPGKKWYHLFMQRHPELAQKITETMTTSSALISEEDIRGWFTQIELFLIENGHFNILSDSTRIFNGDELSLQLCPKSGEIIPLKGEKYVSEADQAMAKSSVAVIVTFGANGDITPPLVVFPNKATKDALEINSKTSISFTESRSMKAEQFYDYIQNVFHPYLLRTHRKFPVVLFVDGNKTPHTLDISELCKSLDIILIALYPNAVKLLETPHAAAFRPLRLAWKRSVLKWKRGHPDEALTKKNFVPLLKEALECGVQPSTIISGFKAAGLCPWNPDAVNYKKCPGTEVKDEYDDENFQTDTIVLQVTGEGEGDIWN